MSRTLTQGLLAVLSLLCLLGNMTMPARAANHQVIIEKIALQRLDERLWVSLPATNDKHGSSTRNTLPIRQLLLQVSQGRKTQLQMQLCNHQRTHCRAVPADGRLFLSELTGQWSFLPLWLGIRVLSWQGSYPPVYLRAELTLWQESD